MTQNNQDTMTLSEAIKKSAIGLAIFAFFTAGIISITFSLTRDNISENEREFEARLLLSILPDSFSAEQILAGARRFADFQFQQLDLLSINEDSEQFYQVIGSEGNIDAVILPAIAPEGYTEAIRLIVGISSKGQLLGVRVTKHKETPGLGDQVEVTKSAWILDFNDKSLLSPSEDQWLVKKDGGEFDQLTGATITPRAIVKAVKSSLVFFQQNHTLLFSNPPKSEEAL